MYIFYNAHFVLYYVVTVKCSENIKATKTSDERKYSLQTEQTVENMFVNISNYKYLFSDILTFNFNL